MDLACPNMITALTDPFASSPVGSTHGQLSYYVAAGAFKPIFLAHARMRCGSACCRMVDSGVR